MVKKRDRKLKTTDLNIERLKDKNVYINFKELCDVLEVVNQGGTRKLKILEYLNDYCRYHREGYKYIIDEFYEEPLYHSSYKNGSNSKEIEYNLFKILKKWGRGNTGILFRSNLTLTCGFINSNFIEKNKNKNYKLKNQTKEEYLVTKDAFNVLNTSYKRSIERVLLNMEENGLIEFNKVYYGKFFKNNEKIILEEQIGNIILDLEGDCSENRSKTTDIIESWLKGFSKEIRPFTKDEKYTLDKIFKETCEEFGYENMSDMYKGRNISSFNNKISKRVREEINTSIVFTGYCITWCGKNIVIPKEDVDYGERALKNNLRNFENFSCSQKKTFSSKSKNLLYKDFCNKYIPITKDEADNLEIVLDKVAEIGIINYKEYLRRLDERELDET